VLKLKLPFPISANRYWQIVGKRLIKTKQARTFIANVVFCWLNEKAKGAKSFKEDDYLALSVAVFYPVKRGPDVDLDNLCKVLIDAMETAQIFPNDKQFRHIQLTREYNPDREGFVRITIKKCDDFTSVDGDTFIARNIHKTNIRWDNTI
jgi:Holliday junction resolvase RusA-like endonuclease